MCRPTAPFKEWRPVRGQTVQRTPEHSGNGFAETVPRNLCDLARAVDSSRRRRPWVDRRDAIVPPRTQTREVAWSSAHASLTRGLTRPTRSRVHGETITVAAGRPQIRPASRQSASPPGCVCDLFRRSPGPQTSRWPSGKTNSGQGSTPFYLSAPSFEHGTY